MPTLRGAGAILAAAAFFCGLAGDAFATADEDDAVERLLLFSGLELSRTWSSLFGGFVWSPDGVNTEGFALKTLTGAGVYRYRSGAEEITGRFILTSVLPGWRFKREGFEASLFAGLDVQAHRLHPNDPGNSLAGEHAGIRVSGETWWEPFPQTMAQAWASWSSVGASYAARGALGWRVFALCYVGPEAQALGDGSYREYRLGLHATAWRTGAVEWSAGVGFARDDSNRSGAYTRFGLLVRQ